MFNDYINIATDVNVKKLFLIYKKNILLLRTTRDNFGQTLRS